MAKRKKPNGTDPWQARCALLLGALEQVRKELRPPTGGGAARALQICDLHLGIDKRPPQRSPFQ